VINVALVLGIAAVARPATVDRGVARVDAPFMLITYALVALAVVNFGTPRFWLFGEIQRWEGVVLVLILVGYIYVLYRRSTSTAGVATPFSEELPNEADTQRALWIDAVLVVLGVVALAGGAELLVRGASEISTEVFGASERFVGIAIVAFGTSLPELFTTIAGISRGEMDISVGNIVGSNIFNSLMVLGTTALVRPIEVGGTDFRSDFAFMTGTTVLLVLFLAVSRKVPRAGGVVFLGIYVAYFVLLTATRTV
jgi:cation:H+ antiporter